MADTRHHPILNYLRRVLGTEAVGGVTDADAAYAKIRAGASLVQIYTALVFSGPALIRRIERELALLLQADGFASIVDAVGAGNRDRRAVDTAAAQPRDSGALPA